MSRRSPSLAVSVILRLNASYARKPAAQAVVNAARDFSDHLNLRVEITGIEGPFRDLRLLTNPWREPGVCDSVGHAERDRA